MTEYSIIICTRNRDRLLRRILDYHAKLDSMYRASREYVIVDNGSTDATRNVIEEFARQIETHVEYIYEERLGHSIALNAGCRAASGEFLIFTDDDTLPDPRWFESIHEAFQRHAADWLFGPVRPRWEFGPIPSWYGPSTSRFLACMDLGDHELIDDALTGCFVGANHACKRAKIFELGLYDEKLGIRGDGLSFAGNDDDLFRKARQARFKMVYSPRIVVEHLIAEHRYLKKTHRQTFRRTGENELRHFIESPVPLKSWFGLPRYYFAHFATQLGKFLSAMIVFDKSRAFYHETQVIRFGTAIGSAIRNYWFHGPSRFSK